MITASSYGRLGAAPRQLETRSGKPMTTARLAVNVAGSRAEAEDTEWVSLLAFGTVAESLAKHEVGDCLGCMGRLERSRWTSREGEEREGWQLVVEALHSSRTVRPGGRRRRAQAEREPEAATPEFNDEIPA